MNKTKFTFQFSHNPLETRPYPIVAEEDGRITGIWQDKYKKVIGFCCEYKTGAIDVTIEKFAKTKQSLAGMYIVVADCDDNFITLYLLLRGAYIINMFLKG